MNKMYIHVYYDGSLFQEYRFDQILNRMEAIEKDLKLLFSSGIAQALSSRNVMTATDQGIAINEGSPSNGKLLLVSIQDLPPLVREHQLPQSIREHQLPQSIREHQLPQSIREYQLPQSIREHRLLQSIREYQLPQSIREHQLPQSIREYQLPQSIREHQLPQSIGEHPQLLTSQRLLVW